MKRRLIPALIICILAACLCTLSNPSQVRATWVWNSDLISKDPEQLLAFARNNRVNLIFLQINPKLSFGEYRAFIEKASLSGIRIHALDGDPSWARKENQHKIAELVAWVRAYNESASGLQKIKGIHLDMEPYNEPGWNTNQKQSMIDGWLSSMDYFTSLTKGLKDVEAGADLPFWLDEVPVSPAKNATPMNSWMLERLDYVTIMAYRDQALSRGGIVDVVKHELETASRLNKKVIVGIETNPVKPGYTTFYDKGMSYVKEQMQLTERTLAVYPSYRGIAIHDFEGWKQLASASISPLGQGQ
ncbi:hypothetical protein O9H85_26790 [Paenibacillus filicis]|uniref:Amidase n=2 Tax=Paenibacillus gyeongsangnamensis TaxID=3388067 RepID=A0ABT4QGG5_9BACL|nr:hypothetical protein [Paenibacillus filicis]